MIILGMMLTLVQTPAFALALSEIQLNSSLNQTLDATIEIRSATSQELDNLNFSVNWTSGSDIQQWQHLQIELVRPEKGNSYLKITTKDAVREPVLEFLLELSWMTGRILREYSLLLNPQY